MRHVATVYADLVSEELLIARRGSGTLVADRQTPRSPLAQSVIDPICSPDRIPPLVTADLSTFPREAWLKAARRVVATAPCDILGYNNAAAEETLKSVPLLLEGYGSDPRAARGCNSGAPGTHSLVTRRHSAGACSAHGRCGPGLTA